jgi:hypothetical protein
LPELEGWGTRPPQANRSGKCAILNSFVGWTRSALGAARRSRQIQSDDRQTDSRLADIGSVLLDETLKNTVCSMTPLLWSVLVNLESPIDDRLPRAEDRRHPRRRWFSLWRDRGSDRLTHCSSVRPESLGQRADGHFFPIVRPCAKEHRGAERSSAGERAHGASAAKSLA